MKFEIHKLWKILTEMLNFIVWWCWIHGPPLKIILSTSNLIWPSYKIQATIFYKSFDLTKCSIKQISRQSDYHTNKKETCKLNLPPKKQYICLPQCIFHPPSSFWVALTDLLHPSQARASKQAESATQKEEGGWKMHWGQKICCKGISSPTLKNGWCNIPLDWKCSDKHLFAIFTDFH